MAREEFLDNLRLAHQLFAPMKMSWPGGRTTYFSGNPWLTPRVVDGFDPADFADWPQEERDELEKEVAAFLAIAQEVPPDQPATKAQSKQARRHLKRAMKVVRDRLLPEWLAALEGMLQTAADVARAKGWYVEKDEGQIEESLLGKYLAPRLRIRTWDKEVMLRPIARFGSGRQGVVDLIESPTYETAYYVTFKDGRWQISSAHGNLHKRPFTRDTFANTITKLSRV